MARNDGKPWTNADKALLLDLYPDESNATLAKIFGRKPRSIGLMARSLGAKKSEAYMAKRPGAFPKGAAPWNKGRKGLDIGGKATRFQPGQKPHTWMPVGSERECDGYLQRKVTDTGYTPRDWRPVHHLVWEEHTGQPVPKDHALVFRDGNRRNFDPDNLELVTRAELMRRNTYLRFPDELRQVIQLKGALNRVINNRSQRHENERY